MADVYVDRMGEIDWNSGITHDDLLQADLITKRLQVQMQLAAHPEFAMTANRKINVVNSDGSLTSRNALALPLREVIYMRPSSVGRAVGSAVFGIISGEEIDERTPYSRFDFSSIDSLVKNFVVTSRVARQIDLANFGMTPHFEEQIVPTATERFIGTLIYPSPNAAAMDTAMAVNAILSGQEVYQRGTLPAIG